MIALPNPFLNPAARSESVADTTAAVFASPPAAVGPIHSSCGGVESRHALKKVGVRELSRMAVDSAEVAPRLTAGVAPGPQESLSTTTEGEAQEPPAVAAPIAGRFVFNEAAFMAAL